MLDKKDFDYYLDLLDKATLVVASKYTQGSPEYMKANKEQVALLFELNEIKATNLLILEELKKLNASKTEVIKPVAKKEESNTKK